MTEFPQQPPTPGNFPDDAYHQTYGNPTTSHPNVQPLSATKYSRRALFAELAKQQVITVEGKDNSTDISDEMISVPMTDLPIVRYNDLEEGIVLYNPHIESESPQSIYIVETVSEANDSSDRDEVSGDEVVEFQKVSVSGKLTEITGESFEANTETVSKPFTEVEEKLTFMQPEMMIYSDTAEENKSPGSNR
jgi:hypothetical protein